MDPKTVSRLLQLIVFTLVAPRHSAAGWVTSISTTPKAPGTADNCFRLWNEFDEGSSASSPHFDGNSTCFELFGSDDCTGEKTIIFANTGGFPEGKDILSLRSYRECQKLDDIDKKCPQLTTNNVSVVLDDEFPMSGISFKCTVFLRYNSNNFSLTFSVEDDSHYCIQFYSSWNCTNLIHREISNSPSLVVYGLDPFAFESMNLCDCSASDGKPGIRSSKESSSTGSEYPAGTEDTSVKGRTEKNKSKSKNRTNSDILGSLEVVSVMLCFLLGILCFVGLVSCGCNILFANLRIVNA